MLMLSLIVSRDVPTHCANSMLLHQCDQVTLRQVPWGRGLLLLHTHLNTKNEHSGGIGAPPTNL